MAVNRKQFLNWIMFLALGQSILLAVFDVGVVSFNTDVLKLSGDLIQFKKKVDSLKIFNGNRKIGQVAITTNPPGRLQKETPEKVNNTPKQDGSGLYLNKVKKSEASEVITHPADSVKTVVPEPVVFKDELNHDTCFTKIQCLSNIRLKIEINQRQLTNAALHMDYADNYLKYSKKISFLLVDQRVTANQIYLKFKEVVLDDQQDNGSYDVNPLIRTVEFEGEYLGHNIKGFLSWRERLESMGRTTKMKINFNLVDN